MVGVFSGECFVGKERDRASATLFEVPSIQLVKKQTLCSNAKRARKRARWKDAADVLSLGRKFVFSIQATAEQLSDSVRMHVPRGISSQ